MRVNTDKPAVLWYSSIFRAAAIQRYVQNQQKTVLPRLVCPKAFLSLWILLGLLFLAGGFLIWQAHGGELATGGSNGVRL